MRFTNHEGVSRFGRFRLLPEALVLRNPFLAVYTSFTEGSLYGGGGELRTEVFLEENNLSGGPANRTSWCYRANWEVANS
jgi:hypothetical protein